MVSRATVANRIFEQKLCMSMLNIVWEIRKLQIHILPKYTISVESDETLLHEVQVVVMLFLFHFLYSCLCTNRIIYMKMTLSLSRASGLEMSGNLEEGTSFNI